jgi:Mrp family chromosome partitioning ATPase
VIGAGTGEDRGIATLNIALAAARDGAKVLLIDADQAQHELSNKLQGFVQDLGKAPGKSAGNRLGWLNIGAKIAFAVKTSAVIQTANGISILPLINAAGTKTSDTIRDAVARARSGGGYDLVILAGPAMPWSAADHTLLDTADGLVAILPTSLDVNDCMEDIITALGNTERKLAGVILSDLHSTVTHRQRDKQYA